MRKVSTGIHGLDGQLQGGYPVGSTILLLAPPSNAAQTFAAQFATGGLLTESEVIYVNTDRPLEDIKAQMADLDERIGDRPDVFDHLYPVDVFQERFDHAVHGHGLDKDLLRRVRQIAAKERSGDYRIVLDTASFLVDRTDWDEARDFLEYVTLSTRRGNGVLLISLVEDMHDPRVEAHLKHLADGWVGLGIHRQGLQATPYVKLGKMRGTHLSNRVLPYEETENGLWLETAMRVF